MDILNSLALLSCLAIATDVVLEIRRIHQTRSSNDLSMLGMSIRFVAIVIILVKLISLKDMYLIIGQSVIVLTFSVYMVLAVLYFRRRQKR